MSFPRYSDYRESGLEWLQAIPRHWTLPPLYIRYEVVLGKMLDTKRITGEHLVPYLRNTDVQWNSVNINDLPTFDIHPEEAERYTLRDGDLLVCEGGEVGRTAEWRGELALCSFQKALHRVRPLSVEEHPRYLYYCMQFAAATGVFIAGGNPNTIPHLTAAKLRLYRFPKPPRLEQIVISEFLNAEIARIDALVDEQRRLIDLLNEKRQAVISHAVTKGLNPDAPMKASGVEWLGDVPAHWEMKRFSRCVRIAEGQVDPEDPAFADMPLIAPNHIESATGRLLPLETATAQGAGAASTYACKVMSSTARSGRLCVSRALLPRGAFVAQTCTRSVLTRA